MFTTARPILPHLVLLLTFLGLAARPAHAQTLSPGQAQVRPMLTLRLMQANALNALLQQLVSSPAAANSSVQSTISLYQAALAEVQYQINQLQLLAATVDQAYAVNRLIQSAQNPAVQASLQTTLANIQAQISNVQATIVVP